MITETEARKLILQDLTRHHRVRMDKPLQTIIRDARRELETEYMQHLMQQEPKNGTLTIEWSS